MVPAGQSKLCSIATPLLIAPFSQVYVMTNGGPASSSSSVPYYIYTMAITRQQFGHASAISVMLFALILVITLVQRRLVKEQ